MIPITQIDFPWDNNSGNWETRSIAFPLCCIGQFPRTFSKRALRNWFTRKPRKLWLLDPSQIQIQIQIQVPSETLTMCSHALRFSDIYSSRSFKCNLLRPLSLNSDFSHVSFPGHLLWSIFGIWLKSIWTGNTDFIMNCNLSCYYKFPHLCLLLFL